MPYILIMSRRGSPLDLVLAAMHTTGNIQPFRFSPAGLEGGAWARWRSPGCLALIVGAIEEGDARRYCLIDVFG